MNKKYACGKSDDELSVKGAISKSMTLSNVCDTQLVRSVGFDISQHRARDTFFELMRALTI